MSVYGYPPYVPVTPLGSLWGFKGDLIVPMVAIGVAIFIVILIVLAVKAALAWKVALIDGGLAGAAALGGGALAAKKLVRSVQLEHENLNVLANRVHDAVDNEGWKSAGLGANKTHVNATGPHSSSDTTPAPSVFTKFQRSIFNDQP